MERNYKVYMHVFPNNKAYIGITMQNLEKRWKKGKGYWSNKFMVNAINKYGWENIKHIVLYDNLTREEASKKEIEMIKKYKTANPLYGYNLDMGGIKNKIVSQQTKDKLSVSHLNKKMPMETRNKIKETLKGDRHGAILYRMKKVDAYYYDGDFIHTYDCLSDAARDLDVKVQNVSLCCYGKIKKTKQYTFKFSAE